MRKKLEKLGIIRFLRKYLYVYTAINLICFYAFYSSVLAPVHAATAKLYLNPPSNSATNPYTVGQTISVGVMIDTGGSNADTVEGVLNYNSELLEVQSITASGTWIQFWVNDPRNYDFGVNGATISYSGGKPNPGVNSASAKNFTINFLAKKGGIATVNNSGRILANGQVLSTLAISATYQIGQVAQEQPTTPPDPNPNPNPDAGSAPNTKDNTKDQNDINTSTIKIEKIFSETHPDNDKWYSNNSPKFNWNIPPGMTGLSLTFDREPETTPPANSIGVKGEYSNENMGDGVWYIHVRAQNVAGWGPPTHFKFNIDKESPENLVVEKLENKDTTEPRIRVKVDATDRLSGMDHYEFKIDNGDFVKWEDDGTHMYTTILVGPGDHILTTRAVDKVGNYKEYSDTKFKIEPITQPEISEYEVHVLTNELILVKGNSHYPFSDIVLWVQKDNEDPQRYLLNSDKEGYFAFDNATQLKEGHYTIWVETVDRRGAKSNPSEKKQFDVKISLRNRLNGVNGLLLFILILSLLLNAFLLFITLRKKENVVTLRKIVAGIPKKVKNLKNGPKGLFGRKKNEEKTEESAASAGTSDSVTTAEPHYDAMFPSKREEEFTEKI